MTTCTCGSAKAFFECCGPLIAGKPAISAEALMRSRYTAFTLGDLDYIQKTSAGEALLKFNRAELAASLPSTEWLGLKVRDVKDGGEGDESGFVTFDVSFRQDGKIYKQTECSEFRRIQGAWRYIQGDADFKSRQAPAASVGRNDPCSCGSGKKYKKCCGLARQKA